MSVPVIDAHVHILPDRVRRDVESIAADDPWFAACHRGDRVLGGETDLMSHLETEGIDRAVVFTWPFRQPSVCAEANDFVAELQRRHPDRIIGCGVIQPGDPTAAAELRRCAALGLRGIGELNADAQGFALEDDSLLKLAAASIDLELPWTLHSSEPVGHAYPGKGTATPERLAGFIERAGGLRLVLAHLGGGLPFYAHMPEIADLCRAVWFDTAALPYLYGPSAIRDVAGLIGAERLLLGTDFPLLGMRRYRHALAEAGIEGSESEAIMGGNALAVWTS